MSSAPKLTWSRPSTVAFPQIWRIFLARDVNSDDLVEYRIQDLPPNRIEDAIKHMLKYYTKDEPITKALGGTNSADSTADLVMIWRSALEQNAALACISYSGEIIGLNINYVITKDESFIKDIRNACKSPITLDVLDTTAALYRNFDVFERYGVDKYLTSFGMSVDVKYRGRGIARQMLLARKEFCESLDIPLTHTVFASDFSSRLAKRSGFTPDVALTFKDVSEINPKLRFQKMNSEIIACKTFLISATN